MYDLEGKIAELWEMLAAAQPHDGPCDMTGWFDPVDGSYDTYCPRCEASQKAAARLMFEFKDLFLVESLLDRATANASR